MFYTFKPTTFKSIYELIIFSIIVCYFILEISFFFWIDFMPSTTARAVIVVVVGRMDRIHAQL